MVCPPATSARPELDGQDPFQFCGLLCQTRNTPTLINAQKYHSTAALLITFSLSVYWHGISRLRVD
jgi:hypothetical protein